MPHQNECWVCLWRGVYSLLWIDNFLIFRSVISCDQVADQTSGYLQAGGVYIDNKASVVIWRSKICCDKQLRKEYMVLRRVPFQHKAASMLVRSGIPCGRRPFSICRETNLWGSLGFTRVTFGGSLIHYFTHLWPQRAFFTYVRLLHVDIRFAVNFWSASKCRIKEWFFEIWSEIESLTGVGGSLPKRGKYSKLTVKSVGCQICDYKQEKLVRRSPVSRTSSSARMNPPVVFISFKRCKHSHHLTLHNHTPSYANPLIHSSLVFQTW